MFTVSVMTKATPLIRRLQTQTKHPSVLPRPVRTPVARVAGGGRVAIEWLTATVQARSQRAVGGVK